MKCALFSVKGRFIVIRPYSRVKIAFRTKRSNVDRVFLVCKGQKNLMFKASSDAQFDYYEVKLQLDNEKISWYFEIQAGTITCYYDFRGVVKRPDEHYNFVLIPGFDTPDWAKGAVMYQIYVDRFCNGDPTNDVLTNEYHYKLFLHYLPLYGNQDLWYKGRDSE